MITTTNEINNKHDLQLDLQNRVFPKMQMYNCEKRRKRKRKIIYHNLDFFFPLHKKTNNHGDCNTHLTKFKREKTKNINKYKINKNQTYKITKHSNPTAYGE